MNAIEFFKFTVNAPMEGKEMLTGMRQPLEKDFEAEMTAKEDLVLTLCCE